MPGVASGACEAGCRRPCRLVPQSLQQTAPTSEGRAASTPRPPLQDQGAAPAARRAPRHRGCGAGGRALARRGLQGVCAAAAALGCHGPAAPSQRAATSSPPPAPPNHPSAAACTRTHPPQDAEERQSEALEIALLNRSHRHRGHDADDSGASPRELACKGADCMHGSCTQGRCAAGSCWCCPAHAPWPRFRFSPSRAAPPAGRALDAAEHLLVKCRPLGSQWGTERFGLADPEVLQAIEVRGVGRRSRAGHGPWAGSGCSATWAGVTDQLPCRPL